MSQAILDILIIGAGQAGLALAWHLRGEALNYQLIERHACIGDNWRKRYESLRLFTPRFLSALPSLELQGDPNGYASRNEFADYLETYTRHFEFPVRLGLGIKRLEQQGEVFQAELDNGEQILSRAVVLATGAFQKAYIPAWADSISASIQQLSADDYQNPVQIHGASVLVVGDGASGRDIAKELAGKRQVILATGRPRALMPEKLLSISSWWWLKKLGILELSEDSFLGKKLKASDSFPARANRLRDLKRAGVQLMPRLISIQNQLAQFANQKSVEVDTIIWATGYIDESDWVAISKLKDHQGRFIQKEGISPIPRLYFLGRPWQRNRASALIAGAGADAEWLKSRILSDLKSSSPLGLERRVEA